MPRFRFKYTAVLAQRQRFEDERKRDLAAHLRRYNGLREQLEAMQTTIRESKRHLGDALVGRVDLDRVGEFARYSNHTTIRAQQLVHQLAGVDREVHAARERLMQATRQRKAMELLRDRHEAAWRAEQQRREQRELDELAMQGHTRNAAIGEATP
ncbi:MAG: flagellar export protein FliJ [Phycisphaeraceae bacterium]